MDVGEDGAHGAGRGPRHEVVACLGKLEAAAIASARGWKDLERLLDPDSRDSRPDCKSIRITLLPLADLVA